MISDLDVGKLLLLDGSAFATAADALRWKLPIWLLLAGALVASPLHAGAATLGVYGGNDPSSIVQFQQWLGCPVQQVLIFTDEESWENIGHPQWFVDRFAALDKPAVWSVAMIPRGSTLEAAAGGNYDGFYTSAARALIHAHPDQDGIIRVRIGWELNGDWFPWAAEGHQQAFIETYRRVVNAFRSISRKFQFEWNINYGKSMDPLTAYPGDQYVDVIGMDFYWMPQFQGSDPVGAFAKIRDDRYGLQYVRDLAARHHKPVALSEWGVQGDNAQPFIDSVRQWIDANRVIYHNYWNSDAAYPGRLSENRWPNSGAAFREAFCMRTTNAKEKITR